MNELAERLQSLREKELRFSLERMVEELKRNSHLPTLNRSMLYRWEKGGKIPEHYQHRILDALEILDRRTKGGEIHIAFPRRAAALLPAWLVAGEKCFQNHPEEGFDESDEDTGVEPDGFNMKMQVTTSAEEAINLLVAEKVDIALASERWARKGIRKLCRVASLPVLAVIKRNVIEGKVSDNELEPPIKRELLRDMKFLKRRRFGFPEGTIYREVIKEVFSGANLEPHPVAPDRVDPDRNDIDIFVGDSLFIEKIKQKAFGKVEDLPRHLFGLNYNDCFIREKLPDQKIAGVCAYLRRLVEATKWVNANLDAKSHSNDPLKKKFEQAQKKLRDGIGDTKWVLESLRRDYLFNISHLELETVLSLLPR